MNRYLSGFRQNISGMLHKSLFEDRELRYRARFLLTLSYGFLFLFTILVIFLIIAPVPFESKLVGLCLWLSQFIGCSLAIYFIQTKGFFKPAAVSMMLTIMLMIFSGIFISGGPVVSKVTYYVLLLPIIAFYLTGIAKGVIWTTLSFIGLVILFVLSAKGFEFNNIFTNNVSKYFSAGLFLLGFLSIFIIILVYENTFVNLQLQHEDSHEKIRYLASHDQLTGIANRSYFYQALDNSIIKHSSSAGASQLALLYMDLVGFKDINDMYGYHTGDIVLQKIAKNLESGVRGTDLVARHGGDEFVILLKNVKDEQSVTAIANKLSNLVKTPIDIVGTQLQVFPSMGIALFPKHAQDAQTLERYADEAMYQAKARKRDWKIYEGEISSEERNV